MAKSKPSPLETKHLIAAGAGMLCPLPVVGEAIVAYGIYPVIESTIKDPLISSVTSIAVAGLTRANFYQPFYLPAMDFISRIF